MEKRTQLSPPGARILRLHERESQFKTTVFEDSLDNFEEAYCGEWDSEEDFARHIIEECYNIELKIAEFKLK